MAKEGRSAGGGWSYSGLKQQAREEWHHRMKESREGAGFLRVGFSYIDFDLTVCGKHLWIGNEGLTFRGEVQTLGTIESPRMSQSQEPRAKTLSHWNVSSLMAETALFVHTCIPGAWNSTQGITDIPCAR